MKLIFLTVITFVCTAATKEACVDEEPGIVLLGKGYDCSYLSTNKESVVGIYDHRDQFCRKESTKCCATCKAIRECVDQPNGIYILGMYKECKYLLEYFPEDQVFGIYDNRHMICGWGTTSCCKSCEIVKNQPLVTESTTITMTTKKPTPSATNKPVTKELMDTCADNCLWIADGTMGNCSWLTDPTNREAYPVRHSICNNGFASGCKKTCQIVLSQSTTPIPTTTAKPTTQKKEETPTVVIRYSDANTVIKPDNKNTEVKTSKSEPQMQLGFASQIFQKIMKQEEERKRQINIFMQNLMSMFKQFQG